MGGGGGGNSHACLAKEGGDGGQMGGSIDLVWRKKYANGEMDENREKLSMLGELQGATRCAQVKSFQLAEPHTALMVVQVPFKLQLQ